MVCGIGVGSAEMLKPTLLNLNTLFMRCMYLAFLFIFKEDHPNYNQSQV